MWTHAWAHNVCDTHKSHTSHSFLSFYFFIIIVIVVVVAVVSSSSSSFLRFYHLPFSVLTFHSICIRWHRIPCMVNWYPHTHRFHPLTALLVSLSCECARALVCVCFPSTNKYNYTHTNSFRSFMLTEKHIHFRCVTDGDACRDI